MDGRMGGAAAGAGHPAGRGRQAVVGVRCSVGPRAWCRVIRDRTSGCLLV